MAARTKARGSKKGKKAASKKRKAGSKGTASPQRRAFKQERRAAASSLPATDAENDIISSEEVIGMGEGPVRCEACNTDFASRRDFERHAAEDHPDIPARTAE